VRTPKATILLRGGDAFNEFCKANLADALHLVVVMKRRLLPSFRVLVAAVDSLLSDVTPRGQRTTLSPRGGTVVHRGSRVSPSCGPGPRRVQLQTTSPPRVHELTRGVEVSNPRCGQLAGVVSEDVYSGRSASWCLRARSTICLSTKTAISTAVSADVSSSRGMKQQMIHRL
jgi:hypothetical protein